MGKAVIFLAAVLFMPLANAGFTATPSSVTFYNVTVGSFGSPTNIYVSNSGTDPVNFYVSNGCGFDFQVNNWCLTDLEPNSQCTIEVSFNPHQEGYQTCDINLSDSAGGMGTIYVSGTAVKRDLP